MKYYLPTMGFSGAPGRKLRASIKPGKNKIGIESNRLGFLNYLQLI